MKNVYLCVCLFFLYCLNAAAQSRFTKGYVVTTGQDTIRGYIDATIRSSAFHAVPFRKQPDDKNTILYPAARLRGAYLSSPEEYLVSQVVEVDKKPFRLNELEDDPAPRYVRDTLLLRLLARGKINLYYCLDETGKRHFFAQKDEGETRELLLIRYMVNGNQYVTLDEYKSQLRQLMSDCPALAKENVSSAYTETALQKIVQAYNTCAGQPVGYTKKTEKSRLTPYLTVGGAYIHTSLRGNDLYGGRASQISYQPSGGVTAGLGLEIVSARTANPFAFALELLWQHYNTQGSLLTSYPTYQQNTRVSFDLSFVKLNYLVKYRFKSASSPFLRLGLSNLLLYQKQNQMSVHESALNYSYDLYKGNALHLNPIGLAVLGGLGGSYRRLGAEVRYEYSFFSAPNPKARLQISTAYVLLSYRLR